MCLTEANTRPKLINLSTHFRHWTGVLPRRAETGGGIKIIEGKPQKYAYRLHYTWQALIIRNNQHTTIPTIYAKAKELPPTYGLKEAKPYDSLQGPENSLSLSQQPHRNGRVNIRLWSEQIINNDLYYTDFYFFKEHYEFSLRRYCK
jgi:hypothetical protein